MCKNTNNFLKLLTPYRNEATGNRRWSESLGNKTVVGIRAPSSVHVELNVHSFRLMAMKFCKVHWGDYLILSICEYKLFLV